MPLFRIYMKLAAILRAVGFFFQLADAQDKPKRPRITGIDRVRLYVTDIDKSSAFYSKNMGLSTNSAGGCQGAPHRCFLVNGQQQIELQPLPSPAPRTCIAEIAHATADLERLRRYLLAHSTAPT